MGGIAFVFSGQGAQYSGMGKDLFDHNPAAAEVFRKLDILRPGTSGQCFQAPDSELAQTANTQPCLFAVELAAAQALTAAGIVPDRTAGFSLGEISALAFSCAVSLEDGFRLVCRRGELMQQDAESAESGMAAVLNLDEAAVRSLCTQFTQVYPVNFNCPGQISVAGDSGELKEFIKQVKTAGGRAVPLRVKGGFHSPFMENASRQFASALEEVPVLAPKVPLYSDYTGKPYEGDFKALLSLQIRNPVRWQSIVEAMIREGVDTFIELGPGTTLCGLIKKIDNTVRTFHVEDCASLEETIQGVSEC